MDIKLLARIGAVIFIAIAITMTAIEASRGPAANTDSVRADPSAVASGDPLLIELRRCQELGAAGASDRDCLHAWAENRRRFLAPGARPAARVADGVAAQEN
jgi:conjugative transfer region protein TrbK